MTYGQIVVIVAVAFGALLYFIADQIEKYRLRHRPQLQTAWADAWTLSLRYAGVVSGGTFRYTWNATSNEFELPPFS